jgi:glycosyltransferase involved in cell wall biosynthesis
MPEITDSVKVSVLLSVLNGMPYLSTAIQSILTQTITDLELIVIDDGSTDESWHIITEYAQRDGRVVPLRNSKNLGTSQALNKGLAIARGDYITRQDADDESVPDRLARQLSFLEANPDIGAVGTAFAVIDRDGVVVDIWSFPSENSEIQETLLDHMCLGGATPLIRRDCLRKIGFYFSEDLSYSEDYDLCLRLAEVTKLTNLDAPLYRYRRHEGSVSISKSHVQMYRKALALDRAMVRRFGPQPAPDKTAIVARNYLRAAILGMASNQVEEAHVSLARGLELDPALLCRKGPLEEMIRSVVPQHSIQAAIQFVNSVFADLLVPTNDQLRIKSRLLAELHMREVFAGAEKGDLQRIDAHLAPAIRHSPRWLLNRGTLALVVRRLVTRRLAFSSVTRKN